MSEIEKLRLRFTSSNHIPIVSINYGVTDFELLEAEIQSLQSRNKVLTEALEKIVGGLSENGPRVIASKALTAKED